MFITLEATEGAGKGTVSPLLKRAVELSGKECVHTRQPGGTAVGETLREAFLWKGDMTCKEEVMLLAVDRKRCWEEIIKPALDNGKVVVCERWNATTVAYQAWGRMPDSEVMCQQMETFIRQTLHQLGLIDTRPDLSILLDMPPAIGLARITEREKLDRMELEGLDFMKKAQAGLEFHHRLKTKWLMNDSAVVNATLPLREMLRQTLEVLQDRSIVTLEAKTVVLTEFDETLEK